MSLNKLFNIEDITEIAKNKYNEVKENIEQINKYINNHNER